MRPYFKKTCSPNLIPVPAEKLRQFVGAVKAPAFDRIYSAWWDRIIPANAKTVSEPARLRLIV
jgi:hypothetical protein